MDSLRGWITIITSSGVGVVLVSPKDKEVKIAINLTFETTNNEVEYEVVLARLGLARELGVKNLEIRSDSQVVVGDIKGRYEAQGDKMIKYLIKVQSFLTHFDRMVITQIPRNDNARADSLARLGSGTDQEIEASKHKDGPRMSYNT